MVDDFKDLTPKARLEKLKQLEKKTIKELDEIRKLIKECNQDISDKSREKEFVPIEEVAKVDLKNISQEAKDILMMNKGLREQIQEFNETNNKTNLEQITAKENIKENVVNVDYKFEKEDLNPYKAQKSKNPFEIDISNEFTDAYKS